jgi:DNA-binding NarL/FixJ family response regulator
LRAVAFDLDPASVLSLREALPQWEIEVVNEAPTASRVRDWNPGGVDLLIIRAREDVGETLGLCRLLACCGLFSRALHDEGADQLGQHRSRQNEIRRVDAPLLVLVLPGQESFVRAALAAGADGCLVLPVHAKEIASMLARMEEHNQPGRHTLNLDQAQDEDHWQDEGGQG